MKEVIVTKKGVEIRKKFKVKLSLSAEDWDLYTMPGSKAAARSINSRVGKALSEADIAGAYKVLSSFSKYGAYDSEPCWVLRKIICMMGIENDVEHYFS